MRSMWLLVDTWAATSGSYFPVNIKLIGIYEMEFSERKLDLVK